MKRISMVLLCVLLVFVVAGCSSAKERAADNQENTVVNNETGDDVVETVNEYYPVTLTDGYEREVVIHSEPQRIISMAPSVTEILYAVGAEDKLVGRTDYCVYPTETQSVQSIGSMREPNIEIIASLNPDLVIASTHFKEEILVQFETLNIPVFVLTAQESFEGVYETIEKAGIIVNQQNKAGNLIERMKEDVKVVLEKVKDEEKKSVYYVIGYGESNYSATGETFISEMLEMAGGNNVAKDGNGWSYSLEKLLEHNPKIILVSDKYDSYTGFITNPNYQDLSAVKENQIIEIDSDLLSIQGPRLAFGLKAIAERLHPEQFK